jgi:DNA-binding response OmpR family regulator
MKFAEATILIVDDNQDIRDLITFILQDNQLSVITAQDGEEALLLIDEHKPELVILDVMMPGLSGIQTLEKIRQSDDNQIAHTPVLMITAKSQSEDINIALKAGANSYIVKPFQSTALMEKISSHLLQVEPTS